MAENKKNSLYTYTCKLKGKKIGLSRLIYLLMTSYLGFIFHSIYLIFNILGPNEFNLFNCRPRIIIKLVSKLWGVTSTIDISLSFNTNNLSLWELWNFFCENLSYEIFCKNCCNSEVRWTIILRMSSFSILFDKIQQKGEKRKEKKYVIWIWGLTQT